MNFELLIYFILQSIIKFTEIDNVNFFRGNVQGVECLLVELFSPLGFMGLKRSENMLRKIQDKQTKC